MFQLQPVRRAFLNREFKLRKILRNNFSFIRNFILNLKLDKIRLNKLKMF